MPEDRTEPARTLGAGRFLRLVRRDGWEYVERTGATGVVAVLALTSRDELVLTEQFRLPVSRSVIDLPAGLAGDGDSEETLQTAARRELVEETGFTAAALRHLTRLPTSPGLTSETVDLLLAEGIARSGPGGGDDSENIEVHLVPRSSIAAWLEERVAAGRLIDPKVYAALWWAERLT